MATAILKLEQDEGGQVIHLPAEFQMSGGEVSVHREGDRVILAPIAKKPRYTREEIRAWFAEIDALKAGPVFENGRNQGTLEPKEIFKD